jgi:hypothetical protein
MVHFWQASQEHLMGPWFHQEVQAIHLQQTRTLQTAAWMWTNNKLWQLKKLELPSQTATK